MNSETRIITAALPFVNNIPHLGNIIGSHLPADIFARFSRLKGYRTVFVGGTDEHGTAIEFAVQMQNKLPRELCDELYEEHKKFYDWFGISYNNFSRTSREIHHNLVKEFFLNLYRKGYIIEKEIKLPFCNSCKKALADRYITGTCPACGYEGADGDQCEKCAVLINPIELIKPFCSVCKSKDIEFKNTRHLFLDLRNISKDIEKWINENANIRFQVKSLARGWLRQGLKERCITRDLKWGINVPLTGYENKVFYVWFDNVIGYISATVEMLGDEGKQLWKDRNVKTYYFVGKDNIPFHTIFWPGQLIAHGEYILPYNVVGLQYLNFEGRKFSKSKGVGIFANQIISSKIPRDYWRFYLTYIIPETKDTDFVLKDFKERINKELIGNFGNFVNRTLNFIWNKLDGKLPAIDKPDRELEEEIRKHTSKIEKLYEVCEFRAALTEILKFSDLGNRYFDKKEPWRTKDSNVLGYCYELDRILALWISPIVVDGSQKIFELLNTNNKSSEIDIAPKTIRRPEILFKKLEDKEMGFYK